MSNRSSRRVAKGAALSAAAVVLALISIRGYHVVTRINEDPALLNAVRMLDCASW